MNSECVVCGHKKGLSVCASCKEARYCSKRCQTVHWKDGHKYTCKITVAQKDEKIISLLCAFCEKYGKQFNTETDNTCVAVLFTEDRIEIVFCTLSKEDEQKKREEYELGEGDILCSWICTTSAIMITSTISPVCNAERSEARDIVQSLGQIPVPGKPYIV
jgi:hypothetical protein